MKGSHIDEIQKNSLSLESHSSNPILSCILAALVLCAGSFHYSQAQVFSRIEAEVSIKKKNFDGDLQLTMGKVYYDKNLFKIVYKIDFPEPEVILVTDSFMYKIVKDKVVDSSYSTNVIRFSVFSLCLNGDLEYYGLKNSSYVLSKMEKEGEMIITTWQPPKQLEKVNGKFMLSQIDKRIYALVSFDPEGNIIGKQFFEEYENIDGLDLPTRVTQFKYMNDKEEHEVTTFKNILLNNTENENFYNYHTPGN